MSYAVDAFIPKNAGIGRAFSLQYTSVILIVLCFTVGGLVHNKPLSQTQMQPVNAEPQARKSIIPSIGKLIFDNPADISSQELEGVIGVLKQHDLKGLLSFEASTDESLQRLMDKAQSLRAEFKKSGLIEASYEFELKSTQMDRLKIRFFRQDQ